MTQTGSADSTRPGTGAQVRQYATVLVRIGLAAVWLWAGLSKVTDPDGSVRAVRAYQLFPEWMVHLVGYGLPYWEITLAVLLLVGLGIRLTATVSAVLLSLFVAGVASAAARGLTIDCGCFGGGGTVDSGQTRYTTEILRDVGLLVVSAALAVWPASRYSADEAIERTDDELRAVRVGPRRTKEAARRLTELAERHRQRVRGRLRRAAAVAAALLVVVTGVGYTVAYQQNKPIGNIAVPASAVGAHGTDGLRFGPKDASVTVDLYEDFQCPVCQAFEVRANQTIKTFYKTGKVQVRYHPIAILDDASTTDYSSRAANVAACTADSKVFPAFHTQVFQAQPPEGSNGLTDNQMIEIARGIGAIEKEFVPCVENGRYDDWVDAVTETASKDGINATPTVLVNGKRITEANGAPPSAKTLTDAVTAAQK